MRLRTTIGSVAAAGLIAGMSTVGFASSAFASVNGNPVISAITPPSGALNQTDLQNDEPVQLSFPAGTFSNNERLDEYACDDPAGLTTESFLATINKYTCDGTAFNFYANSTGGLTTPNPQTNAANAVTLYSLPNAPDLGESTSNATCDLTDECILVFTNTTANPDDGVDVAYSQPFFVDQNYDYFNGQQAPAPLPEVPYTIILPLAAAGLLGGAWVINRSRKTRLSI